MNGVNLIKIFGPVNSEKLLKTVYETHEWLEKYSHKVEDRIWWDVLPQTDVCKDTFLLRDTSIYAGAAGIALFYLRLYKATGEEGWLKRAEGGINYVIGRYNGLENFKSNSEFLPGADIGFLNGPAGGAYVASRLYEVTGESRYRDYAISVTDDLISAAHEEEGALTWYGTYGIIGEGSLILYLLDAYETFKNPEYLKAAEKAARYIAGRKENAPVGGYRWYAMPTENFPTIRKKGGYFPGFEYGAAGCGYILASVYSYTGNEEFLDIAKGAATYITNLADYTDDTRAALVRYNDTYLTDLYYLGVCQGPVGTSRLFFKLYEITGEDAYREFVEKLSRGILVAGAPSKHSAGYWHTNCYCCGAPGMLEHFINIHKLTHDRVYLNAAYDAAQTIIGESTYLDGLRKWYTSWNRHEPFKSEAYTGLYLGSAGCASSLLTLSQYLSGSEDYAPYLEDPYKSLFRRG
ncbi:MAG: hypothetical protein K6F92_00630 [Lachnospiraceae bacterium]|nr:hypothetical protein [Lachnospiraceae bacterium]